MRYLIDIFMLIFCILFLKAQNRLAYNKYLYLYLGLLDSIVDNSGWETGWQDLMMGICGL